MQNSMPVWHPYLWSVWLVWLAYISRKCQYVHMSDLLARILSIFFSNWTPASRRQWVTGCCSYHLQSNWPFLLGFFIKSLWKTKNRGKESHKYMAVAGINHKWRGTQRNILVRATIKNVSSQACIRLAWHKQMHMRLQTSVNGWKSLLTWLIQLLCLNQISFSHLVLMNVKVKTIIKNKKGTWKH